MKLCSKLSTADATGGLARQSQGQASVRAATTKDNWRTIASQLSRKPSQVPRQ
jgi:hypothetical protein